MPTPESNFSNRAKFEFVVERIADAIHTRRGFSLLRLGDGEGPVLNWSPAQSREIISPLLNIWFGRSDFDDTALNFMATELRKAVSTADIIGLPTEYQLSIRSGYQGVFDGILEHELCSPSQLLTDANLHWYLQWSGAIAFLLRGLDFVGVIGCRNIGPQIAEALGIGSVHTYLVRGEHNFPGEVLQPHWPDAYLEIMNDLHSTAKGKVFLIGAGVLGKLYCAKIKSMGGIALDIGSLLDSWANVPSRIRYQKNSPTFTLDHLKVPVTNFAQMRSQLDLSCAEFDIRTAKY